MFNISEQEVDTPFPSSYHTWILFSLQVCCLQNDCQFLHCFSPWPLPLSSSYLSQFTSLTFSHVCSLFRELLLCLLVQHHTLLIFCCVLVSSCRHVNAIPCFLIVECNFGWLHSPGTLRSIGCLHFFNGYHRSYMTKDVWNINNIYEYKVTE